MALTAASSQAEGQPMAGRWVIWQLLYITGPCLLRIELAEAMVSSSKNAPESPQEPKRSLRPTRAVKLTATLDPVKTSKSTSLSVCHWKERAESVSHLESGASRFHGGRNRVLGGLPRGRKKAGLDTWQFDPKQQEANSSPMFCICRAGWGGLWRLRFVSMLLVSFHQCQRKQKHSLSFERICSPTPWPYSNCNTDASVYFVRMCTLVSQVWHVS